MFEFDRREFDVLFAHARNAVPFHVRTLREASWSSQPLQVS